MSRINGRSKHPEVRFAKALQLQGYLEEALAAGLSIVSIDYGSFIGTVDYPIDVVERMIEEFLRPLSFEKQAEFRTAAEERMAA